MMSNAISNFCRICTEAIVIRLNTILRPFDSFSPSLTSVGYTGSVDTFVIRMVDTTNLKYSTVWYLDDAELPGVSGFSYALNTANLGTGTHSLKCRMRDTTWYTYANFDRDSLEYTRFVRNDPDSALTDSVVWILQFGIGVEGNALAMSKAAPSLFVYSNGSIIHIEAATFGAYDLGIYDIRGKLIKHLGSGTALRPTVQYYRPNSAGIYFIRMISKGQIIAKKAVIF